MNKKLQLFVSVFMILMLVGAGHAPVLASMKSVNDWYEQPQTNDESKGQADQSKDDTVTAGTPEVTFFDYVKMIFALIFVVALIYFLLKFINQKGRSFQQTKMINHLGGAPLGGNRSVQVVKVGNQVLVLGVGEDIQLLKEIADEQEKQEILSHYGDGNNGVQVAAKERISTLMTKIKGSQSVSSSGSFQSHLKNQLEEMSKGRKRLLEDLKNKEKKSDE
ncbi:flagellar biosynthetic protein FliO [Rossellomorea aquimaris]|uniref:flagellar biosynthetic protein FliO n=1 Tax=Rossellomorea aquimaris TaxID=189382 RepID=UPI001CD7B19B|nr:flagellar biosynthetic protein FliO [Rossellomorea aquimaris]MCA1053523.1 flagellar biosynthetic protein FliO [Rossellomorea aquimaris]